MNLVNHVHVSCYRDHPCGKGVKDITLNGQRLEDVVSVDLSYDRKELNQVTLVLNAHVTADEVDE